ncbi:MAG: adenylate/guanylate cyclase domain-containing protein [Paracoccaceae bacterium]
MERKLAAILAADVVGYSRMMSVDEENTLAALKACRARIDDCIGNAGGNIFGSSGDSVIAEFGSPVKAVRCALDVQESLANRNRDLPENEKMLFRIGINLGDVVAKDGNLFGDGVNVAARIEALAPPGGICISRQVVEQITGKVDAPFTGAGSHKLKNIPRPIEVFVWPEAVARKMRRRARKNRWAILATIVVLISAIAGWYGLRAKGDTELPTGARIALMPFENVGTDKNDAYFSEGLSRDVSALLAKFSNLFIIAPEATAKFRDEPGCERILEELGADYILRGSVQRSTEKLRVTTTFTDAKTCRQLSPPGPFDVDLSAVNLLDVQLEIARKVPAEVGSSDSPLFRSTVAQEIRDKAPESLNAYECVFLSFWFYQTFTLEGHRKARDCLLRTVESEPNYSLGWSRLAYNYLESKKRSFDTDPNWAQLAREAANKALDADRDNPDIYYALAILSRMTGKSRNVFLNFANRAIELNPNDSWILADLGIFLAYSGEWEKGEAWITRARALNPLLHPGYGNAFHLHAIVRGDYEEAKNVMAGMGGADGPMNLVSMSTALALNGEQEAAEALIREYRESFPENAKDPIAPFRARGMPPELIAKIREGLELAGLDVPPHPVDND